MAELARCHPQIEARFIDTRGAHRIAFAPWFFARALLRVCAIGLGDKPAVLHVNVASYGSTLRKFVVVGIARGLRTPVILHVHGALFETFYGRLPPWQQRGVRWMFRRSDRVVVLGARAHTFVLNTLGIPAGQVEVIANGVPRQLPAAAADDDTCDPLILFLGRLGQRKGVGELIAALASLELLQLPWRAVLAGDGDAEPYVTAASRLGIRDRLEFSGWLDDAAVHDLLRRATVLVLPSHGEGLPMAVVEALAHAVPVVTTPVGALPDYLKDEQSVLFVPAGNVRELSRALHRVLIDPALRARLAEAGHAVFRREFDIAVITGHFVSIYQQLAGQPIVARPRAEGIRDVA